MILDEVYAVILDRRRNPVAGSYVSSLLSKGKDQILKKIGEESAEVIIASKSGSGEEIVHELADLWFHCLVLMAEERITPDDLFGELRRRSGGKGVPGE